MYHDERKDVMPEAPVMIPLEPWQRTLLAAAEYLRTWGWCQHIGERGHQRCLQSAISHCVNLQRNTPKMLVEAYQAANGKLAAYVGARPELTHQWNDAPGRTVDEVIAALEGAARA